MSDWDFLYEMNERGYSPEEIADAAGSGAAPWEWDAVSIEWIDSRLSDEPEDAYSVDKDVPFQSRDGFPFNVHHKVKSTGFQPVSFSSENEGAGGVNCSKNFRI